MQKDQIAVVGAGVMGLGIAQTLATAGFHVRSHDTSPRQLTAGADLVHRGRYGWDSAVRRGLLTAADVGGAAERLIFTTDLEEAIDGAELTIEAVPERIGLKIEVLKHIDRAAASETVLVSNTSGLSIAAMASATDRPDRVLGWHWASPAQVRPFAEIVPAPWTSPETLGRVVAIARACRKNPIVVRESEQRWGFVANRILMAAVEEARRVLGEGLASSEEIDQLMRDAYAWPIGPLSILDGASDGWGDGRSGSISATLGADRAAAQDASTPSPATAPGSA